MNFKAKESLVAVSFALTLAACGPKLQSVSDNQDSTETDTSTREAVAVGVNIAEKGSGLKLASSSSFNMSLDGCASGLTVASITQTTASVSVYKYDRNCLVKLNSFVISGITYTPTAGDPFTSWATGDIATFADTTNAANQLVVVVSSQLNNPISATESVSYTFTQVAAGTDETIAKSVVGDSHALSVSGVDAATIDIVGVTMTGMTSAGAGQFTLKVECDTNVTGSAGAYTCGNNTLASLKYVLVEDTYSGTLTAAQAGALFTSAGTSVASADQFGTGTTGALKGGFNTQTVTGPNAMHTHPNMLFVVQSGGTSYKYFNVDVSTLTYP